MSPHSSNVSASGFTLDPLTASEREALAQAQADATYRVIAADREPALVHADILHAVESLGGGTGR